MKLFLSTTALALAAGTAGAATLGDSTGFGLAADGNGITVMSDLSMPGSGSFAAFTGGAQADALAYRPSMNQLYAYSNDGDDSVFTVSFDDDFTSATLSPVGSTFTDNENGSPDIGSGVSMGGDFNNAVDAARFISVADDNNVFFPDDFGAPNGGTTQPFTDLFYAEGDTNAGVDPQVFANAYTNALRGVDNDLIGTTQQYAIDAETNALVTLANNAGTLETIGVLTLEDGTTLDVSELGGFDILSTGSVGPDGDLSGVDELAVALLDVDGMDNAGLYTIDLATATATFVGMAPDGAYADFAAVPGADAQVIPLPASALLLLGGVGGLGLMRRRKG